VDGISAGRFGVLLEYELIAWASPALCSGGQRRTRREMHTVGADTRSRVLLQDTGAWGGYVTGGGGFYANSPHSRSRCISASVAISMAICYPQYANVTLSHFSATRAAQYRHGHHAQYWRRWREDLCGSALCVVTRRSQPRLHSVPAPVSMIPVTFGIRFYSRHRFLAGTMSRDLLSSVICPKGHADIWFYSTYPYRLPSAIEHCQMPLPSVAREAVRRGEG